MHVVSHDSTTAVKGQPPPQPLTCGTEETLLALTEQLAEREGIPLEVAYGIVQRHITVRTEGSS